MSRLPVLIAALWMGSLWTVCGVVAPGLFAALEDRRLAGDLAGEFFRIETWIGIGLGALLVLMLSRSGRGSRTVYTWIAITALAPLVSELILGPFMGTARAAGNMTRFGLLHAGSAALFLVACAGALLLVLKLSRPAG